MMQALAGFARLYWKALWLRHATVWLRPPEWRFESLFF